MAEDDADTNATSPSATTKPDRTSVLDANSPMGQKIQRLEAAVLNQARTQQNMIDGGGLLLSGGKLQELETQVKDLAAKVEDNARGPKPPMTYMMAQQAHTLLAGELRKVKPILLDVQSFFHQGGLDSLKTRIVQLTRLVHPLTQQEQQDWNSGELQDVKDLLNKVVVEQANLETNVKDLAARADGQAVELEGVTYRHYPLFKVS
ncbi:hypothetical protein ACA910_009860 [Epithemia clementina (nom. ined.)]